MKSSLYFGKVRHHRRAPRKHDLSYSVFMPHLFLDELGKVFHGRWLWSVDRPNLSAFHRKDYHQPRASSLEEAVRSTMSEQIGKPVRRDCGQPQHQAPPREIRCREALGSGRLWSFGSRPAGSCSA